MFAAEGVAGDFTPSRLLFWLAIGELILGSIVIGIESNAFSEIGTGRIVISDHGLSHSQVEAHFHIVWELATKGLQRGHRALKVTFEALDQSKLVTRFDMRGIEREHPIELAFCSAIVSFASQREGALEYLLDLGDCCHG